MISSDISTRCVWYLPLIFQLQKLLLNANDLPIYLRVDILITIFALIIPRLLLISSCLSRNLKLFSITSQWVSFFKTYDIHDALAALSTRIRPFSKSWDGPFPDGHTVHCLHKTIFCKKRRWKKRKLNSIVFECEKILDRTSDFYYYTMRNGKNGLSFIHWRVISVV